MAVLRKIFSSLRKLFGRPAPSGKRKKPRRKVKRKVLSRSALPRRKPVRRSRPARPSRKKVLKKNVVSPSPIKTSSAKVQPSGQPVGEITHYFSKIQVTVVKMTKGNLAVGDKVRIQGRSTDFTQTVRSMQVESVDVRSARRGQLIGLKVEREARVGDRLYRLV